ncbi:hypothetical protein [Caballeronia sp. LjRoot31]|jgi:hypothetical protein|uniref:hypothetical protein n=1 Tax=Caballeronia sp. LjRoot31 TaxID=3342324 RepID=UPI003ECC2C05
MVFKVAQSEKYKVKVEIETNTESGRKEKSTFNVMFKRLSQSEITELVQSAESLTFEDLMARVLLGWDGLIDADNEPLEFNEANRAALFEIPEARFALREAYWDSVRLGKQKN